MSVPKLRFPEFADSGEWEDRELIHIADRVIERNKDLSEKRVFTNSAIDGVVDQRDYFDKDIANQENLNNYFILENGDFVYNPRISVTAPVGPISKNKLGKGVMSPLYTVFRFKNSANTFFEYFYKTDIWHKYLKEVSNTGARHDRMAISNNDFMKMPLPYPSLPEQQKIADCLSSLDDLIAAHKRKLDALKTHKKGLMQQLFPAEGETVPRLRFPEFENAGEWEEKRLGDIIELLVSGVSVNSTGDPITNEHEIGILKTSCIANGIFIPQENKQVVESEISMVKTSPKRNSIIFSRMNTPLLVGESGYVTKEYPNLFLPDRLWNICCDEKNVNTRFVSQYLITEKMRNILKESATGTSETMKNISQSKFTDIQLFFPSLPEQQKIADCLSSLDELVTAQAQKIEALKNHKKGLMQQLFPAGDE